MNFDKDKIKTIAASFDTYDDISEVSVKLRIWQISKGRYFVFVIYTSEDWHESRQVCQQEMKESEAIVASIRFRK